MQRSLSKLSRSGPSRLRREDETSRTLTSRKEGERDDGPHTSPQITPSQTAPSCLRPTSSPPPPFQSHNHRILGLCPPCLFPSRKPCSHTLTPHPHPSTLHHSILLNFLFRRLHCITHSTVHVLTSPLLTTPPSPLSPLSTPPFNTHRQLSLFPSRFVNPLALPSISPSRGPPPSPPSASNPCFQCVAVD